MGPRGLREWPASRMPKRSNAAERIAALPGFDVVTPRPFYNELLVRTPHDGASVQRRLVDKQSSPACPLAADYPDLQDALLLAFTEHNTRAEIDRLARR